MGVYLNVMSYGAMSTYLTFLLPYDLENEDPFVRITVAHSAGRPGTIDDTGQPTSLDEAFDHPHGLNYLMHSH
ncbi:hypothetical protein EVAR_3740_1 [Eumeta japonica]|uniref:Uncharacterized protein n=1 Tax=Eumeta variegata TaxID=151549 RepID=A0A4C1SU20_EUMVA|nr:hypothetical protein EVAR_3740_1 [Eumeta japonica]